MHVQPGILENLQEHTDILMLNASRLPGTLARQPPMRPMPSTLPPT
jgi:hypothetical protein